MLVVLVVAVIWPHLRCVVDAEKPKYFNVGLMFPIATPEWTVSPGVKFFAAMDMAIDEINNKHDGVYDDILPFTELRMVTGNRDNVESGQRQGRHCLCGTGCSSLLERSIHLSHEAHPLTFCTGSNPVFAEAGNIPQIAYNDRSSILGDSRAYPNLLRTVPGTYHDAVVIADLVHNFFGWSKVTLFASTDNYGSQSSFRFKDEASKRGIDILSTVSFSMSEAETPVWCTRL